LQTLTTQDIEDLIEGARIMGTGGGGEVEWVRPLIEKVWSEGRRFRLIDPNELRSSDVVVIVSLIGGGITPEQRQKVQNLRKTVGSPEQLAFALLGKHLGHEPTAVIPTELGAGNTLAAMCAAAMLDKPAVDADCMGRAKPELQISTTNVSEVPITPICLVTNFGDELYLDHVASDARAEDILRAVAAASGGLAGVCRCPMGGDVLRRSTVLNSVSKCVGIGRTLRQASPGDGVERVVEELDGKVLFEGKVSGFGREERGAFMWGETALEGSGSYSGHGFKIWFKNEHLMSWKDGQPFVTCPDTILTLDAASGRGLSNWGSDFAKGRKVVVVGLRANRFFESERGIELFGPRAFGFDIEHMPIGELLKRRP
jgi:uncharacterized protein